MFKASNVVRGVYIFVDFVNVRINITGMGETNRHRMAKQLAAADLLEKVKKDKGEEAVGEYGLLPGCRTSPMIYEDLRELCRLEKLASMPVYTQLASGIVETADLFSFRCAIGLLETVGNALAVALKQISLSLRRLWEQQMCFSDKR